MPFGTPVKVKAPEEFAVTVAVADPVSLTVAPEPPDPLIVPLMLKVCAVELKLAVLLAPLMVTAWFVGVKIAPDFEGVTVYDPLASPVKLYAPEVLVVVVAVAAPVSLTVAPDAAAPVTVPVMLKVCTAELKLAVLLPPFTVTA